MSSAIEQSRRRDPALILLGGEAGVGKTRLIDEFTQRLARRADPPLVLRGDATPPTQGELPFAALVGALRPLIRGRHPAVDGLADADRAQLSALFPTLGDDRDPDRGPPGNRLSLFESLFALIAAASASTPTVLIVEDCHWADRSTLGFIDYLARSMRDQRLTVILSYRTDDPGGHDPLRRLLAELHRRRASRRLELDPFTREELGEALAGILEATPDPTVLDRLLRRSDGNPLYAEELLAAARDGSGAMPATVSDALLARLEALGPSARPVSEALAVGGRLDERALVAVTGLDPEPAAEALLEALRADVIVTDGADGFRFRHALMRETVYEGLLPGRRVALHLALADHCERELTTAVDPDGEVELSSRAATHWLAGGERRSALRTLVRAAALTGRVGASEHAAELLTTALELWPQVPDAPAVAGCDHVGLLTDAARAVAGSGDARRADTLFEAALDELGDDSPPRRRAELRFEHARVQQLLYRLDEATANVQGALRLIEPSEGDPLGLQVRSWLMVQLVLGGRYREAQPRIEEMLAETTDDVPAIRSDLLGARGFVQVQLGDPDAGLVSMHDALKLARRLGDEPRRIELAFNLGACLSSLGRQDDALEVLAEAIAATPVDHGPGRDRLQLKLALVAFEMGDWATARARVDEVRAGIDEVVSRVRSTRIAEIAAGVGDLDLALAALQERSDEAERSPETMFFARHAALMAEILARRGELSAAAAVTTAAARRLEDYADDALRAPDLHLMGIRVHADRAERARDIGDLMLCDESIEQAGAHLAHLTAIECGCTPFDRAQIVEGRAHEARARGVVGSRDWSAAAAAWDEMQMPYRAAIARLREAELRLLDEERDLAASVVRAALEVARRIGSRWLIDELHGLAGRGRLGLGDAGAPTAGLSARDEFDLTSRERQVLARLAQGDTNRQIGDALFISDKTVSTHVSRIFAKLGVRGRTEAAAVAHRHGLTVVP